MSLQLLALVPFFGLVALASYIRYLPGRPRTSARKRQRVDSPTPDEFRELEEHLRDVQEVVDMDFTLFDPQPSTLALDVATEIDSILTLREDFFSQFETPEDLSGDSEYTLNEETFRFGAVVTNHELYSTPNRQMKLATKNDINLISRSDLAVFDYNIQANRKPTRLGQSVQLRGAVQFSHFRYLFPIRRDYSIQRFRELLMDLCVTNTFPPLQRRALIMHGILHDDIAASYPDLFDFGFTRTFGYTGAAVAACLIPEVVVERYVRLPFFLDFEVVIAPVVEEFLKMFILPFLFAFVNPHFDWRLTGFVFGLFEFCVYDRYFPNLWKQRLLPLLMHSVMGFIPGMFTVKVLIHAWWNFFSSIGDLNIPMSLGGRRMKYRPQSDAIDLVDLANQRQMNAHRRAYLKRAQEERAFGMLPLERQVAQSSPLPESEEEKAEEPIQFKSYDTGFIKEPPLPEPRVHPNVQMAYDEAAPKSAVQDGLDALKADDEGNFPLFSVSEASDDDSFFSYDPDEILTEENLAMLSSLGDFAWVLDVIRKFSQRDWTGLTLSACMKLREFVAYLIPLGIKFKDIIDSFKDELMTEEYGPKSEWASFIEANFPSYVSKSASTKKVWALVTLLFQFEFVRDLDLLPSFVHAVGFKHLAYASLARVAYEAIKAVWQMLKRLAEGKSWRDIFEPPRDVLFIRSANALLHPDPDEKVTQETRMYKVVEARQLLINREYIPSTAETGRLCDKLRDLIDSEESLIRQYSDRVFPFLIWLNGAPGTGKSAMITSLVNYLLKRDGIERETGDFRVLDIEDKYPMESRDGIPARKCKVICINEVKADTSQFPMVDKTCLGLHIQRILDIFALMFRASAIENKGEVFTGVRYLIITTNHFSFKTSIETDKLNRRMLGMSLYDVQFRDMRTKKLLKWADTVGMDQGVRNASTIFTEMKVDCKNDFITFTKDGTCMSMTFPDVFLDVAEKSLKHFARVEGENKKFSDHSAMCKCGIARNLHVLPQGYKKLSDLCENPDEKPVEVIHLTNLYPPPQPFVEGDETVLLSTDLNTVATTVGLCAMFYYLCVIAFQAWGRTYLLMRYVERIEYELGKHPQFYRIVDMSCSAPTKMVVKLRQLYLKLKRFYHDHYVKIGALLAGSAVLWWYLRESKGVDLLANPIFSHQVREQSMKTLVEQREMNYETTQGRTWNKEAKMIRRYEPNIWGNAASGLLSALKAQSVNVESNLRNFRIVALNENYWITNRHCFTKGLEDPEIQDVTTLVWNDITWTVEKSEIITHPDTELVLFPNRQFFVVKPLHKHFGKGTPQIIADGWAVNESISAAIKGATATFICPEQRKAFQGFHFALDGAKKGICSTGVVVSVSGAAILLGFVAFGRDDKVGASFMTQEIYEDMVKTRPYPLIDFRDLNAPDSLLAVDKRSHFREQDTPYLVMLGSSSTPQNHFKTKFVKTEFYPVLSKELSVEMAPPNKLGGVTDDGTFTTALTAMCKNINVCNQGKMSVFRRAKNAYLADVLKAKKASDRLAPCSLEQAMFGIPGFIDRVEFKTSCGPVLGRMGIKNKYHLFRDVPGSTTGELEFRQEVLDAINKLITDIDAGIVSVEEVAFAAKDEVKEKAKMDEFKVRLFSVLSFVYNIVCRMHLMPLIKFLLDHPSNSECYGQMNAGSKEWTHLWNRLHELKGRLMDMDFSKYDYSHDSICFELVAEFFHDLALAFGYTGKEAARCYFLVRTLDVQLASYMGTYAVKTKGMPSGVIITLILNSIMNSILMRYAFIILVHWIPVENFQKCVTVSTVGDDNLSRVLEVIMQHYNFLTIKDVYAELGYIVTPAMKNGVPLPFIDEKDAIFVKRKFVQWSDGFYRAPLDKDSIFKALCFQNSESGVSPVQRLADVIGNAQREAYLHGREFFLEVQEKLKSAAQSVDRINIYQPLDFDVLDDAFLTGTFKSYGV